LGVVCIVDGVRIVAVVAVVAVAVVVVCDFIIYNVGCNCNGSSEEV